MSVEGFSALKQKTTFASQINQHQWEFLPQLTISTATVALGGQTWCFKSFWADTIFTLIQAKRASKCPLEPADLRSPLALCRTIYFCGSGGNLGGKKSIPQYCWARMGCLYFFWMLQLLYNQICEHWEDGLAQLFLRWELISLCPQHHSSPENPNPVIFPKPSSFQSHVQAKSSL